MNKVLAVVGLLGMAAASNATAENYVGVAGQFGNVSVLDVVDFSQTAIVVKAGTEVHPNLDIEAQLGLGLSGDNVGATLVELDNFVSVLVKPKVDLTPKFSINGIVGLTRGTLSFTDYSYGLAGSTTETGLSLGLGGSLNLTEAADLVVEYINYYDDGVVEYGGLNIGLNFSL